MREAEGGGVGGGMTKGLWRSCMSKSRQIKRGGMGVEEKGGGGGVVVRIWGKCRRRGCCCI